MAKTLLEVLEENQIETFEGTNGRYVAHCPFHEGDREPSFTIYPNESYYCFGCQVWGNPVKFLVEYKGMSAKDAMEYVGVDYQFPKTEKSKVIKIKNLTKSSKFLFDVAEQYHQYLLANPGPIKYLKDRGLTSSTITKFKLGYTDGAVLNLQFAEELALANELGLVNKNGAEAMSHRITIPNIIDGRYADFLIGRTVINDRIKYLGARMPKPICGFYDSRNSRVLFLVEGNFDYLILRQWGYPAIVMSGSHISKSNYGLLKDKLIVMVPDNDEVGIKSANAVKKALPNTIILDYRDLEVKDIGELAVIPGAEEAFAQKVKEVLWDTVFYNRTLDQLSITSTGLIQPLLT